MVHTHIIPLLRNNTSGSNILKPRSYHIILNNNYEDERAYVFTIYKDDVDPMQVQTEAFSMSTMFQGNNCKNFLDILEHLQSLHPTKCALILNLLTSVHLILINPAISCTRERTFSVAQRIKT